MIVQSAHRCEKYLQLYHTQSGRPFCKGGGNLPVFKGGWECWWADIESEAVPSLGKGCYWAEGKKGSNELSWEKESLRQRRFLSPKCKR